MNHKDTAQRAADLANRMMRVCAGEPTAEVYIALSMMIGAAAARAARPDFDGCMELVKDTALYEFNRSLAAHNPQRSN